jgi:hypothetical protein
MSDLEHLLDLFRVSEVSSSAEPVERARDCYHVLLQSGRMDSRVHHFYESLGFEPGVRIGYVARRPKQLDAALAHSLLKQRSGSGSSAATLLNSGGAETEKHSH